jgi:CBS domain-containing protein
MSEPKTNEPLETESTSATGEAEGAPPAASADAPVAAPASPAPAPDAAAASEAQAPPAGAVSGTVPAEDDDAPPSPAPAEAASGNATPDEASADAPATDDDAPEVEPESLKPVPAKAKARSHHPPPPPSLRFKSVITDNQAGGAQQIEARFIVASKPRVARDLMTRKIFTIGPNDTLEHLEDHMQAFRFRHLPVVDGDKVVGLITHRDLLHASSSFLSERAKERDEIIHKLPASRVMRRDLVSVRPDAPLEELAVLMWQKKIGCILVTDEDGLLVGIVTEADFIRLAHHFLVEQTHRPA